MRTLALLSALALAAPLALAGHPGGSGPDSLGGATVPPQPPLVTIEAEDFEDLRAGRAVEDAEATGGTAWVFETYGAIATNVTLPSTGVVWIEIRARGEHDEGLLNPHLHADVDGEQRAEYDVRDAWAVHRQSIPMLEGTRLVEVLNFNNYWRSGAPDRTLFVDWMRVGAPTLEGVPVVTAEGVVVDAPEIHAATTGAPREDDTARDGTLWFMWGAGCFSEAFVVESPGVVAVTPRLLGDAPGGVGSAVTVRVDARDVDAYAAGDEWVERTTEVRVDAGAHVLDVCYDNDFGGDEKRNLRLDDLALRLVSEAPAPVGGPAWPSMNGGLDNARHRAFLGREAAAALEPAWSYEAEGQVTGTPAFADGVAWFADWGGTLHALDAATGDVLWTAEVGAGVDSSVALDDARVFVGDKDGNLSAFDRATGERLWRVRADDTEGTHLYGSPVAHGGVVYTGVASEQTLLAWEGEQTFRGSVAAFDAETGDLLWRTRTQPEGARGVSVWSTPAIDPDLGLLFVGTGNAYGPPAGDMSDSIVALRLEDGSVAWVHQATDDDTFDARGSPGPDADFGSSPVLFEAGGRALVGAGDKAGHFFALDRATGALAWTTRVDYKHPDFPPSANEGFLGTPAVAGGLVFGPTTARSAVHALDAATGETVWRAELNPFPDGYDDRMFGSTSAGDGVVVQGNAAGRLFLLDAATGDVLANVSAGGAVYGGVSVAEGLLLVPHAGGGLFDGDGGVAAFRFPVEAVETPVPDGPEEEPDLATGGGDVADVTRPEAAVGIPALPAAGALAALALAARRRR